jgi:acetyl esterase/lipase
MYTVWPWLRMLTALFLLGPLSAARAYILIPDITYQSPGSTRNQLDVILPQNGPAPGKPTLVYIHGGAWHTRDKRDDMPVYIELTNHGFAVVPCNYTLAASGSPSFPQAVQDVKNVVRWVRTEGAQYDLSPMVVVVGPSAGGHLAMMAAITSGVQLFETLEPPMSGYRPDAFITIAGFSDLEWHVLNFGQQAMFIRFLGSVYEPQTVPLYRSASPIFHVTPCDPPGAFLHGTADLVVPHAHSLMMSDIMSSLGIYSSTILIPGGGHSYEPFGGALGVAQHIATMVQSLQPRMRTADLNGDGLLNVLDFTTMLNLFAAGDPHADIDGNGHLNIEDFTAYISLFAQGC